MSLAGFLNQTVQTADEIFSGVQVRLCERRGGLVSLFLHNLFIDDAEIERNLAYPQQCLTLNHLRQVIEYFQAAGHRFVSPPEVIAGLDPAGRYVLLTFDDGYFNNQRSLPLLEKYNVPALFFVPAQHVAEGRAFWWDVLYRIRIKQGRTRQEVFQEIARRVTARTEEIEAQLLAELGITEFKAVSDTDRLFTPTELRHFAAHPKVFIGNHGCLHEYLTAYSATEAAERIRRAQQILQELTQKTPEAIAYPCGVFSDGVVKSSCGTGLKLGVTTVARKEYVGNLSAPDRLMRVGRFTVWGHLDVARQCHFMRGDMMVHTRYRGLIETIKRRRQ